MTWRPSSKSPAKPTYIYKSYTIYAQPFLALYVGLIIEVTPQAQSFVIIIQIWRHISSAILSSQCTINDGPTGCDKWIWSRPKASTLFKHFINVGEMSHLEKNVHYLFQIEFNGATKILTRAQKSMLQ